MKTRDVRVVRIYSHEAKGGYREIFRYLHDEARVQGVTVFRGISGFGRSGKVHSATLLDMSLDLPVVIEFFDSPDKVAGILEYLNQRVEPGHILTWPAAMNSGE